MNIAMKAIFPKSESDKPIELPENSWPEPSLHRGRNLVLDSDEFVTIGEMGTASSVLHSSRVACFCKI
jgi:hypothetical protein